MRKNDIKIGGDYAWKRSRVRVLELGLHRDVPAYSGFGHYKSQVADGVKVAFINDDGSTRTNRDGTVMTRIVSTREIAEPWQQFQDRVADENIRKMALEAEKKALVLDFENVRTKLNEQLEQGLQIGKYDLDQWRLRVTLSAKQFMALAELALRPTPLTEMNAAQIAEELRNRGYLR